MYKNMSETKVHGARGLSPGVLPLPSWEHCSHAANGVMAGGVNLRGASPLHRHGLIWPALSLSPVGRPVVLGLSEERLKHRSGRSGLGPEGSSPKVCGACSRGCWGELEDQDRPMNGRPLWGMPRAPYLDE